ncbi:MAG: choice-of-anchor X domain-containing protein [Sumerlaeia bacterium]
MTPKFRLRLTSLALVALLAASGAAAKAIPVVLVYDDSHNPAPPPAVFFTANWDPRTGEYLEDWGGFPRYPMFDDGQHQDGAANDGVWGVATVVQSNPGILFHWATDNDAAADNGWLGQCDIFMAESQDAIISRGSYMPGDLTPAELESEYGVHLARAMAPVRLGQEGRVLFTYYAPEAMNVFLAGSFNNWADNKDGVVTDRNALMLPAGDGLWYRTLAVPEEEARYKYAVRLSSGEFVWTPDPRAAKKDESDNSILSLGALRTATARQMNGVSSVQSQWTPFTSVERDRLLEEHGRVLVYFRMKDSDLCRAFESGFLQNASAIPYFALQPALYVNVDGDHFRDRFGDLGIFRVPAFAFLEKGGEWKVLMISKSSRTSDILAFLDRYRGEGHTFSQASGGAR